MKYLILPTCLLLAAAAGCSNKTGTADSKDGGDVAVINGKGISRSTFDFYVQGVTGKPAAEATPEQKAQLLDNLIKGELVAADAEKTGIAKQADTQAILELTRLNVMQQQVSQNFLKDHKTTDEDLKKEYDSQVSTMPKTEYRARHILVATEAFAKKLIEQLDKGAKFEDLAKKHSKDSSAGKGGDLDWTLPANLVPEFAQAMTALKKGETSSKPIQTQFGWHIIRLDDVRNLDFPAYDKIKGRIASQLQQQAVRRYVQALRAEAKVE